jgi:hypothetical protein
MEPGHGFTLLPPMPFVDTVLPRLYCIGLAWQAAAVAVRKMCLTDGNGGFVDRGVVAPCKESKVHPRAKSHRMVRRGWLFRSGVM